jgi:AraC family transcriptional regulator
MQAQSERGHSADLASGTKPEWLGNSLWQGTKIEISGIKSWAPITAVTYHREGGESVWRGDRHRLVFALDQFPQRLLQIEQGATRQTPPYPSGTLGFCPAGLTVRNVLLPAARYVQVLWNTDLYSTLLPELGAAASRFELTYPLQDALLSQIVTTLVQIEGGFAEKILVETLGTALLIRIARRFVGHLPLPTSGGLSPERLQRVRDYVEAHLDDDLSLTILAGIACLSPYHFSRSFKQATGVRPQRHVIQRRIERAKRLLRQTRQPLALIAQEAGFADQSHLTQMFRREMGMTPGRFRAALA